MLHTHKDTLLCEHSIETIETTWRLLSYIDEMTRRVRLLSDLYSNNIKRMCIIYYHSIVLCFRKIIVESTHVHPVSKLCLILLRSLFNDKFDVFSVYNKIACNLLTMCVTRSFQ